MAKRKIRKKREINDNICPLCKQDMQIRCTGYSQKPFVDGKKYAAICHTCWCVPKIWYYQSETDTFDGPYFDGDHLYTPEEMMEEGACDNIKEAKLCVKAVKASIKKNKKI